MTEKKPTPPPATDEQTDQAPPAPTTEQLDQLEQAAAALADDSSTFVTGTGKTVVVEGGRVTLASGTWPLSVALRLGLIVRQG